MQVKVTVCCTVPDPPFRNPLCGGQIINNQTVLGGCIPQNQDSMLDFQDFVNFIAGAHLPHS